MMQIQKTIVDESVKNGTNQSLYDSIEEFSKKTSDLLKETLYRLMDERDFWKEVFNSLPFAVLITNKRNEIVFANRAASEVLSENVTIDDLIGKKCHQIFNTPNCSCCLGKKPCYENHKTPTLLKLNGKLKELEYYVISVPVDPTNIFLDTSIVILLTKKFFDVNSNNE